MDQKSIFCICLQRQFGEFCCKQTPQEQRRRRTLDQCLYTGENKMEFLKKISNTVWNAMLAYGEFRARYAKRLGAGYY